MVKRHVILSDTEKNQSNNSKNNYKFIRIRCSSEYKYVLIEYLQYSLIQAELEDTTAPEVQVSGGFYRMMSIRQGVL